MPTDVTDQAQIDRLVERRCPAGAASIYSSRTPGSTSASPSGGLTIQDMERSMAVNFYSHVSVVLAVLPAMRVQKGGHVLLVASMDAKKGIPLDAPYVAAKYALSGFGEVLRQELGPAGIAVTTLYPGRVDTPMIENLAVPRISAKIPRLRRGRRHLPRHPAPARRSDPALPGLSPLPAQFSFSSPGRRGRAHISATRPGEIDWNKPCPIQPHHTKPINHIPYTTGCTK